MKSLLGVDKSGHRPIEAAICGATATLSHDLLITPFDVMKQRLQLGYHRNILDCARAIIRTEGISAFYVSYPTTLAMNLPYGCVMVSVNESLKKILNPLGQYNFTASVVSGFIAGAVASVVTTPLDIIKTRLQTQGACPTLTPVEGCSLQGGEKNNQKVHLKKYRNLFHTFTTILKEEGAMAFTRGIIPRAMYQSPSVAISWTAYESAKYFIHKFKNNNV